MEENKKQGREKIEWLNYWIEDADKDKERIILIGDSVTRDLRKKLNLYMKASYSVDLIAMSYGIMDEMVLEELRHYFDLTNYRYKFILYQMGAHHGYHVKCAEKDSDMAMYEHRTKEILVNLNIYGAELITIGATYEKIDVENSSTYNHNIEIEKRNGILKKISDEMKICFLDLNKEINYSIAEYVDNCHFCDCCYEYIAGIIIRRIFTEIEYVSANQIKTLNELNAKLNSGSYKKIYIYGNGTRGKSIEMYMKKRGIMFNGFIVSDEYAESDSEVFTINQIEREGALIIVTPQESEIWRKLNNDKYDYISLGASIYSYINMDNKIS